MTLSGYFKHGKIKGSVIDLIGLLSFYGADINYVTKEVKTGDYVSIPGTRAVDLFDDNIKYHLVLLGARVENLDLKLMGDYVDICEHFREEDVKYIKTFLRNGGDPNMGIGYVRKFNKFKLLVDAGGDWEKDYPGFAPHWERESKDGIENEFKKVKYLIEKFPGQFDINRTDKYGNTILGFFPELHQIRFLLENKADPNIPDRYGQTPLMNILFEIETVMVGNMYDVKDAKKLIDVLKLFAEYKTNFDHQDSDGNTVMHQIKNRVVLEFMYNNGASIDIKNKKGITPRDMLNGSRSARIQQGRKRTNPTQNLARKVSRYVV
jgi:hypothetical protein